MSQTTRNLTKAKETNNKQVNSKHKAKSSNHSQTVCQNTTINDKLQRIIYSINKRTKHQFIHLLTATCNE